MSLWWNMAKNKVVEILDDIDDYEQSVNACLTIIHIYKWDDTNSRPDGTIIHHIGKSYNPGGVTPDVTIQLSEKRGLVIELKGSLPKNESEEKDFWKEKFDQIKKYDKQLEGWNTTSGKIDEQELILLVDQKISRKVVEYIESNNLTFVDFSKNLCVIQYSPASGRKNAVFVRIESGGLGDFKY